MKKDIHPQGYRFVVFQDLSDSTSFLMKSTVKTKDTIKHTDGNEYPLVKVHISSATHPFFTGQEKLIDIEGRVDKFKARSEEAARRRAAAASKGAKVRKEQDAPVKLADAKK